MSIGKSEHAYLTEKLEAALAKVAELENEATDSMAAFVLVRDENTRLKAQRLEAETCAADERSSKQAAQSDLRDLREETERLKAVNRLAWDQVNYPSTGVGTQLRELREAAEAACKGWGDYRYRDHLEAVLAKTRAT